MKPTNVEFNSETGQFVVNFNLGVTQSIVWQMTMHNVEDIPWGMRMLGPENPDDLERRTARNRTPTGEHILAVENCSPKILPASLWVAGYPLVDATCQKVKDLNTGNMVYKLLFYFSRREDLRNHDCSRISLQPMCDSAIWNIDVYSNPRRRGEVLILDEKTLRLRFSTRRTLMNGKEPRTKWRRDEAGHRIGKKPLPIKPDYYIGVKPISA